MKTAIYVRVSTNTQFTEGYSLQSQIHLCLQKCKELNIPKSEIEIYREEGVSGEDLNRPALNQLRHHIELEFIHKVLCVHPDRLSRDLTDKLIICREFEKHHVHLLFVDSEYKNTPEGQLFFNMQSSIAQYELALIKKRTTRGRLEAVRKQGKIMPMRVAPYGYDLIDAKLIINEEEAIFVKKIYDWYVYQKLTIREIGEKLYELNAIPKRKESKNWSASSIRRILTSQIYIGKYYYNQRKTKKLADQRTKTGKPRKTYTYRDPKEWLVIDVPPIINDKLYHLAQQQKIKNTKKSGHQKFDYLLKSLIKCATCGRMYQVTTYYGKKSKKTGQKKLYAVYRCPNIYPTTYGPEVKKCNSKSIPAHMLENYLWNIIAKAILSPHEIINHYKSNINKLIIDTQHTLNLLEHHLQEKKQERERIKHIFIKGFIDESEMTENFKEINDTIKQLKNRHLKYTNYMKQYHDIFIDHVQIKKVIENINNLLRNNAAQLSFQEKRLIIENLIDHIHIKFDQNLENVKITIFGAINHFNQESCSQF